MIQIRSGFGAIPESYEGALKSQGLESGAKTTSIPRRPKEVEKHRRNKNRERGILKRINTLS